jgi:hypothetical protein
MWRQRGIDTRRSVPEISDETVFTETLHVIENLHGGSAREKKLTCLLGGIRGLGPSKGGQVQVLGNLGCSLLGGVVARDECEKYVHLPSQTGSPKFLRLCN